MKNKIVILVFTLSLLMNLQSQEMPLYYLGGYASYNHNIHWANFRKLGDIPNCCPEFTSGNGPGVAIGGLFEYVIIDNINVGARLGFSSLSALLTKDEIIGNHLSSVLKNGVETLDYVTTTHTIDSKIYSIGFEPYINYKFFGKFNSYLGFNFAYLLTAKINAKEKIVNPNDVTFLDGRIIQNDFNNIDIPGKSTMLFFGIFGLGYDLPLNETWILTPEIKYSLPLNNICAVDWKISTLQIGASLKIPVYPAKQLPVKYDTLNIRDTTSVAVLNLVRESISLKDREYNIEETETSDAIIKHTVIHEKYERQYPKLSKIDASITAIGIKQDGSKQTNPSIVIEETEVEEGFPLLPYIFFAQGSSDLKNSNLNLLSHNQTSNFNEDSLPWKTMDIYSNLLNIVGYRLSKHIKNDITIVGCNNNESIEKNNIQLSKDRANSVKKYLVDVWGISEQRIKIKAQNLPDIPGNVTVADGIAENQRAEIKFTDNDLIKPVYLKDIQRSADPPVIAIYPKVESEAAVDNYVIDVNQNGNNLRHFEGRDLASEIIWQLEDKPVPEIEAPIDISLNAKDKLGQSASAMTSLKLQQLTIKKKRFEMKDDKRIEKFFLIVFDFNSAEIKLHHKPILNDIKSRIMPDSKVTISGYTDRIGDPEYNKELAKRRCLEVQKYLQVSDANLQLNPVGASELLYNNDTPQGRSYSRTVQIIVETPVK